MENAFVAQYSASVRLPRDVDTSTKQSMDVQAPDSFVLVNIFGVHEAPAVSKKETQFVASEVVSLAEPCDAKEGTDVAILKAVENAFVVQSIVLLLLQEAVATSPTGLVDAIAPSSFVLASTTDVHEAPAAYKKVVLSAASEEVVFVPNITDLFAV